MRLVFSILSFFASLDAAIAVKAIDIFYDDTGDDKSLRVVCYDTTAHRFESISFIEGEGDQAVNALEALGTSHRIVIDFESVELKNNFNSKDYLLRTNLPLDYQEGFKKPKTHKFFNISKRADTYDKRYAHVFRQNEIDPGSYILETLPKPVNKKHGADFPVHKTSAKGVQTLCTIGPSQKGELGEIATELTILSHGYDQLASKIEGNHGLDGVFMDQSLKPEYFITETKCRRESVSAEKIFNNELSEQKIFERIKPSLNKEGIDDTHARTNMANLHQSIVDEKVPVYRMAHRVRMDGTSQLFAGVLSPREYRAAAGEKNRSDKIEEFVTTYKQFSPASRKDALDKLPR